MRCDRIPRHCGKWWTLWVRTSRRPSRWQYHTAWDDEPLARQRERLLCDLSVETLVLPPGEQPIACKSHCHRDRE